MSVISGTVGAILGADAQHETSVQNAHTQEETNQAMLNYQLGLMGEGGKPVVLPYYTGTYEKDTLFPQAQALYDATGKFIGSPEQQIKDYQAAIGEQMPAFEAGNDFIKSIYSGGVTNERLANAVPEFAARTALAKTQKQGVLDALSERLNAVAADQARAGYVGSGTLARNRALASTIQARQAAAGAEANATLANASDARNIRDAGLALKYQALDLPAQRAQQGISLKTLPVAAASSVYAQRMSPLETFRRPGANVPNLQAPKLDYIPSAAQIAFSGMGAANQQVADYFLKQKTASDLQAQAANDYNYNRGYQSYFGNPYSAGSIYSGIGASSGNTLYVPQTGYTAGGVGTSAEAAGTAAGSAGSAADAAALAALA